MERNRNPKTCVITLNGSTTEVKKEKLEEQKVTISHNRKLSTCTTEKEAAKNYVLIRPRLTSKFCPFLTLTILNFLPILPFHILWFKLFSQPNQKTNGF